MKFKESEIVELKKSTSELKEAMISIVAILNKHQKGELYFGITNDNKIVGQNITENTLREISKTISDHIEPKIYPKINKIKLKGKNCVKLEFQGNEMPYYAYGRVYIRVGDENKQLSAKEIENLILKKNKDKLRWENQFSNYNIKEVNQNTIKSFIKKANLAGRIDFKFDNAKNILKKLNLIKDGNLLKAVEVLFCNENSLEIQLAVFAGKDKTNFLDIRQFKGNIFDLLKKSESYIIEHINWGVKFGKLEREEVPEIPIKAIREALVNSLCHRDYSNPKSNEVAIFKDKVEIYNPGDFPKGFTPEDFIKGREKSILRNPLIAEVLYKAKEIEKWGSGLKRIYEECEDNNVNLEFNILKSGFSVVFYRKRGFLGTTQKTTQKLLELIKKNPYITRRKLSNVIGISEDGIKFKLNQLKKKHIIKRIGPDKGGYWEVIKF